MKSRSTINRAIRALRRAVDNPETDQRTRDQCYGASEALRWITGDGPPAVGLIKPVRRDATGGQP